MNYFRQNTERCRLKLNVSCVAELKVAYSVAYNKCGLQMWLMVLSTVRRLLPKTRLLLSTIQLGAVVVRALDL